MAYLAAPLQLHDVRDVEKLACSVIARRGPHLKGKMTPERDERLVAFLVEEAWRFAHDKFDPSCPACRDGGRDARRVCAKCGGSGKGASFSKLLFEKLSQRLIDWTRAEFGDSRYPNRPTLEQLDVNDGTEERRVAVQLQTVDDLSFTELGGVFEGLGELSPHAQWLMLEIVAPLADFYTERDELAKRHGVSEAVLAASLDELAGELGIAA